MSQDQETASAASPAENAGASGGRLAIGTTLADGRYTIEQLTRRSPFAEVYLAIDGQEETPVSVHLLHRKFADVSEVRDAVERAAAAAYQLDHKNLVRTLAFAREGQLTYVVTEYVEGIPLRELLARKQETGSIGFGLRGTKNILGAVCAALDAAHPTVAHGALSADTVYVNKAGRVKVSSFALAAALPAAVHAGALSAPVGMAPEVAKSGHPSPAGDIFATGLLLYHAIAGRELIKGGPRPSEVEQVAKAVDELVARCAAPNPGKRPKNPVELNEALARSLRRPSTEESVPIAEAKPEEPKPARRKPGARPSLAQAIVAPKLVEEEAPPNFDQLADTEEKYLISKGRLDYGPFSLAAIVEDIKANQVLPGHIIIDKDTGSRVSVEDHPLLAQLVDEAKQRRDDARRAQAEEQHSQQEARRGFALYAFIAAGVLAVGLGGFFIYRGLRHSTFSPKVEAIGAAGSTAWEYQIVVVSKDGRQGDLSKTTLIKDGAARLDDKIFNRVTWPAIDGAQQYHVYRTRSGGTPGSTGLIATVGAEQLQVDDTGLEGDGSTPETRVAALEEGTLEAKLTFPKAKKRRGKRHGKRRHKGSGGGDDGAADTGGGFDFMSEGGQEVLDQSEINPVIQTRARKLGSCLLSKGASRADIEFTIMRTGRVSKVTVTGANDEATACIRRVVKSMKFPSFDGNYTIAQFDMSL